jgi:hypothetical protein
LPCHNHRTGTQRRKWPLPNTVTETKLTSPAAGAENVDEVLLSSFVGRRVKEGEEEQAAKASQTDDRSSFAVHDHVVSSIEHYEFHLQITRPGNEESSWEDEQQLFLEAPQTVVEYWKTFEGGREKACSGMWKIYKIFDEREAGDETTYLVGWIGSLDRGREPRTMLLIHAQGILADWEKKQATKRAKEEGSDYELPRRSSRPSSPTWRTRMSHRSGSATRPKSLYFTVPAAKTCSSAKILCTQILRKWQPQIRMNVLLTFNPGPPCPARCKPHGNRHQAVSRLQGSHRHAPRSCCEGRGVRDNDLLRARRRMCMTRL